MAFLELQEMRQSRTPLLSVKITTAFVILSPHTKNEQKRAKNSHSKMAFCLADSLSFPISSAGNFFEKKGNGFTLGIK